MQGTYQQSTSLLQYYIPQYTYLLTLYMERKGIVGTLQHFCI